MNYDQARASGIKQTRREILTALNAMYHIGPFSFECVCSALTHLELPDEECVKRDLTYLCEKRYVAWTNERQFQPWPERLYRLTAAGSELADKIEMDRALEP